MQDEMKMNRDKVVFKAARKNYRATLEKILRLETSLGEVEDSDVIKFRREFSIPRSGFKFDHSKDESGEIKGYFERDRWFLELAQNKVKFERYQQRLRDLATHSGFEIPEEIDTLEQYLLTGEPIIVSGDISQSKIGWHNTRVWDTAPLARKLKQMRKDGKSYKEMADYFNFNKIKPPNVPRVTTTKLRQVISRANQRLKNP